MMRAATSRILLTLCVAAPVSTQAARPVHDAPGEQLVLADGTARPHLRGVFKVPARRGDAWRHFERSMGAVAVRLGRRHRSTVAHLWLGY